MALENLTTETQADSTSVVLLKKTIAELPTQVNTLTTNLEAAQSENTRLKISGHFSAPENNRHCLANVGAPSDQNPLRDRNIYSRSGQNSTPTGISHLTGLRSKNPILLQLSATRLKDTKIDNAARYLGRKNIE